MSRSQNKRSLCCISRQTLGNNKFVARLRIRYVRTYKCNDFQNRTYRGGTCRGWGRAHRCRDCASCNSHQSQPKPTIEVQTPKDSTHGSCLTLAGGSTAVCAHSVKNPTFHHNVPHFNSHRIDARVCTYSHLRSTTKFCNCRINWPLGTWQPCAQAC